MLGGSRGDTYGSREETAHRPVLMDRRRGQGTRLSLYLARAPGLNSVMYSSMDVSVSFQMTNSQDEEVVVVLAAGKGLH
ncbi:hypothetical protein OIU79_015822 [Salix purpurea]|uniref:Uncharacterized protein n=1 Tax=Salix purpurea TaxID=77065 RepID=A0A9Q0PCQ9_SALPP|nr:hypothetical protein OIU79_015822 [Salix purpurea]